MVSDKTIQEIIYPALRVFLFVFSIVLLNIFITPFLGTGADYHHMLVKDGITYFLFVRFLVLIFVFLLSTAILFTVGKICKRKTTKKTVLILFCILLFFTVLRAWSFIISNY